jgi:hypothetical protein
MGFTSIASCFSWKVVMHTSSVLWMNLASRSSRSSATTLLLAASSGVVHDSTRPSSVFAADNTALAELLSGGAAEIACALAMEETDGKFARKAAEGGLGMVVDVLAELEMTGAGGAEE